MGRWMWTFAVPTGVFLMVALEVPRAWLGVVIAVGAAVMHTLGELSEDVKRRNT